MSWVATAVVGGSVVSGFLGAEAQSEAAGTAAAAEVQSAKLTIDEQRRQFDALQELLSPYVAAGTGVGGLEFDPEEYLRQNPDVAAHPVFGTDPLLHYEMYGRDAGREFTTREAPVGSLFAQQALLGLRGAEEQQAAIAAIEASPAYEALVTSGEEAILQHAAATGGIRGGDVQASLAQFRPQVLSQLIEDQYSKLGELTRTGQASAVGVGAAGQQMAGQIGQALQQSGTAQAQAALTSGAGQAQAWNTVGSGISTVGMMKAMDMF